MQMKYPASLPYVLFLAALLAFNALIFATPLLASGGDEGQSLAHSLHMAFSPTCHQLTSRSLCLFVPKSGMGYSVGDCFQSAAFVLSRQETVEYADKAGYKLPVCARDVAIYLAMLAGLLALPLLQRIESEDMPNFWFLAAAAVPIGLDGGLQLLGVYESTNLVRLITGAIIGVALPFYLLPIINVLFSAAAGAAGKIMGKK